MKTRYMYHLIKTGFVTIKKEMTHDDAWTWYLMNYPAKIIIITQ